jgi:hypothetical protein
LAVEAKLLPTLRSLEGVMERITAVLKGQAKKVISTRKFCSMRFYRKTIKKQPIIS